MRHENWKFVFCEQRASGDLNIREAPFTSMRLPKIYSLRMDPQLDKSRNPTSPAHPGNRKLTCRPPEVS